MKIKTMTYIDHSQFFKNTIAVMEMLKFALHFKFVYFTVRNDRAI